MRDLEEVMIKSLDERRRLNREHLNNKLKELELQEQEEIERILADLSAQAGEHVQELLQNQKLMTHLDFVFAKAKLAMDQNATEPLFNKKHYIQILIKNGYHEGIRFLVIKLVVPILVFKNCARIIFKKINCWWI